jgi:steroid 5-alpha reductase family enzyme
MNAILTSVLLTHRHGIDFRHVLKRELLWDPCLDVMGNRLPNYFGDALAWWGISCVAAATPQVRWTAFAPALMTFLLLRVSGVALLERNIGKRRPEYADYVTRTSAFVPWFPKRGAR